MTLQIHIEGDIKAILRDLDAIERRHVPLATLRALNRTLAHVRTRAKRELGAAVGVPPTLAARWFRQRKATGGNPAVLLAMLLRPIPASRLRWRETRSGVRAGQHTYPSAFVAAGIGDKLMVFSRKTDKRTPLEAHKIPVAAAGTAILERLVRTDGRAKFAELFERDLKARLARGA